MQAHLITLAEQLGRARWDRATLARYQEEKLRALLQHARASSPFHAERLSGVDLDRMTLADLPSLPIMSKQDMMDNFDRIVTAKGLSRSAVESHLERTDLEASLLHGEYMAVLSGGSSGRRGVFVYSKEAATEYLYALFRTILPKLPFASHKGGRGLSMSIVAAGTARHSSRALPSLFGGGWIATRSVAATQPLASIRSEVQAQQPAILLGYPSILKLLAEEQQAGRLNIAPAAIVSCSEQLTADARALISSAFHVGVFDQFASSEGVIGVSPADRAVIALAGDLAIVELLDENDRPVRPGEPSVTVLLTNIFNPVQPLIRYRMQDRFVLQPPSSNQGHVQVTVEGRTDDVLRYGSLIVHPAAIRSELHALAAVNEYQIFQTKTGIHVELVASGGMEVKDLCARLIAALCRAGLREPTVTAELKDFISRDSASGKLRQFVPLTPASASRGAEHPSC